MGSSNTDQIQDYSHCNLLELTSPPGSLPITHLLFLPPKNGCCVTNARQGPMIMYSITMQQNNIFKNREGAGGRRLPCLRACSAPIEVLIFV